MAGINRIFGRILKHHRLTEGITQEKLGELLNVSRVSIANYENGHQGPPLEQVVKAALLLNFSLDEIKRAVEMEDARTALSGLDPEISAKLKEVFGIKKG